MDEDDLVTAVLAQARSQEKKAEIGRKRNLSITSNAFEKMHRYQYWYEQLLGSAEEFYAYPVSQEDSPNLITDIYLPSGQKNIRVHTALTAEQVAAACAAIHGMQLVVRGWTHCHPHFGTHPSGTDRTNNVTVALQIAGDNSEGFEDEVELGTVSDCYDGNSSSIVLEDLLSGRKFIIPVGPEFSGILDHVKKEKRRITRKEIVYVAQAFSMVISGFGEEGDIYCERVTKVPGGKVSEPEKVDVQIQPCERQWTDRELVLHVLDRLGIEAPKTAGLSKLSDEDLEFILGNLESKKTKAQIVKSFSDKAKRLVFAYKLNDPAVWSEVVKDVVDAKERLELIRNIEQIDVRASLLLQYMEDFSIREPAGQARILTAETPERIAQLFVAFADERIKKDQTKGRKHALKACMDVYACVEQSFGAREIELKLAAIVDRSYDELRQDRTDFTNDKTTTRKALIEIYASLPKWLQTATRRQYAQAVAKTYEAWFSFVNKTDISAGKTKSRKDISDIISVIPDEDVRQLVTERTRGLTMRPPKVADKAAIVPYLARDEDENYAGLIEAYERMKEVLTPTQPKWYEYPPWCHVTAYVTTVLGHGKGHEKGKEKKNK